MILGQCKENERKTNALGRVQLSLMGARPARPEPPWLHPSPSARFLICEKMEFQESLMSLVVFGVDIESCPMGLLIDCGNYDSAGLYL